MWYLHCEAEAEKNSALTMADGKVKEGVKIENSDHISLKVMRLDGSVVPFVYYVK